MAQRIGILGTGDVGTSLANGFHRHGWSVFYSGREAGGEKLTAWMGDKKERAQIGTFADAVKFSDIVILAVAYRNMESCLASAGGADAFKGKLVIDPSNPLTGVDPQLGVLQFGIGTNTSAGEQVQKWLPEAKVVKCFSCQAHTFMVDPPSSPEGHRLTMWIAGNDADAVKQVQGIIEPLGWKDRVVTAKEGIAGSRWIEPLSLLFCNYGFLHGTWKHGVSLVTDLKA